MEWTITSGSNWATLANTASVSNKSSGSMVYPWGSSGTNERTGQCTVAPWRSANILTMLEPMNPVPPVT